MESVASSQVYRASPGREYIIHNLRHKNFCIVCNFKTIREIKNATVFDIPIYLS